MYGIDPTDDFSIVLRKEICQVAVGSYDLQLNWGSGGLQIEGRFRYRNRETGQVFRWTGAEPQIAAKAVALLRQTFTDYRAGKNEVTFIFSNGDELSVYDDLKHEVLKIRDGKNPLIVI